MTPSTKTLYEHVFIARQDITPQRAQALIEEFSATIAEQGGNVAKTEYWGLCNLAYQIKKNRKGHYMLLNIEASHTAITEMERQMKLHDDILRFLTLRVDEHDPNPSPPMQRSARDETRHETRHRDWPDDELQDEPQDINEPQDDPQNMPQDMPQDMPPPDPQFDEEPPPPQQDEKE